MVGEMDFRQFFRSFAYSFFSYTSLCGGGNDDGGFFFTVKCTNVII